MSRDVEDKKEALKSVGDLVRLQITLASSALVFTGTIFGFFLKLKPDTVGQLPVAWLFASWVALALSIGVGLFTNGQRIHLLSQSKYDVEDKCLSWLGRAQQVLFFSGIAVFGIFAILALT